MTTPLRVPSLGLLWRLASKELREILRDRRTILTLVLMPLLLYPLLGVAFRTFLAGSLGPPGPPVYLLATMPKGGNGLDQFLHYGQTALKERDAPEWNLEELEDLETAVTEGRVQVAIRFQPADVFEQPRRGPLRPIEMELLYREDSTAGREAARYLEGVCAAANARDLSRRLRKGGLSPSEVVRPRPIALPDPRPQKSALLPGLVPLILILMTITGAVYPAIDVTAGERERGTLEILAAAPVSRLAVLAAKYVAVLTVALLTAMVNLGAMMLTLQISGVAAALLGPQGLTPLVFVQVLALLLLFAAFFSAVLLVLTSFARSFKEAQAYLVPLMLLALMPGVLSLVPGLKLEGPLALAPLLNIALLTRDLLEGTASPGIAVVVVAATLVYALAALAAAARVFGAEAVLYSQSGGWTDLFRRR